MLSRSCGVQDEASGADWNGQAKTARGSATGQVAAVLVFLREGVRASSDRYVGGGKSTTADRQIGYGARAFPHAVIDLDEIWRLRQRSPL